MYSYSIKKLQRGILQVTMSLFLYTGVIARHPSYLPYIKRSLTEEAVTDYFKHLIDETPGNKPVVRYRTQKVSGKSLK